jgi:hypothetical protein
VNATRALALAAVGVLAVAGCADAMAGGAVESPVAAVSLSVDPCTLLTGHEIQQLGLVSTGRAVIAGSRNCSWEKPGQYTVGFGVWDNLSLAELSPIHRVITNYPVGSHLGRQVFSYEAGCGVFLQLTPRSLVDAVVVDVVDSRGCPLADQFAKLMEPRLPKGVSR